eukprot:scaffold60808_cov66-Phaeocystis_antarctica.AAC.9
MISAVIGHTEHTSYCRCHRLLKRHRRRRHGLLKRLGYRCRLRPNPHHLPGLQHRCSAASLCRRLLLRLVLGLLLRLHAHAALPHLAWRCCERRLERRQSAACDSRPQHAPPPRSAADTTGLGTAAGGGAGPDRRGCWRRLARLVACGGRGAACLLLIFGLHRAGVLLGGRCFLESLPLQDAGLKSNLWTTSSSLSSAMSSARSTQRAQVVQGV